MESNEIVLGRLIAKNIHAAIPDGTFVNDGSMSSTIVASTLKKSCNTTCHQATENQGGLSSFGVRVSVPGLCQPSRGTHSPYTCTPASLVHTSKLLSEWGQQR